MTPREKATLKKGDIRLLMRRRRRLEAMLADYELYAIWTCPVWGCLPCYELFPETKSWLCPCDVYSNGYLKQKTIEFIKYLKELENNTKRETQWTR